MGRSSVEYTESSRTPRVTQQKQENKFQKSRKRKRRNGLRVTGSRKSRERKMGRGGRVYMFTAIYKLFSVVLANTRRILATVTHINIT